MSHQKAGMAITVNTTHGSFIEVYQKTRPLDLVPVSQNDASLEFSLPAHRGIPERRILLRADGTWVPTMIVIIPGEQQ